MTATLEARERRAAAEGGRPAKGRGDGTTEEKKGRRRGGEAAKGDPSAPESPGRRNRALGARGEEAAARFLERRGYRILERNWTCFAGEADIIAVNDEALIFVEVKTRRGEACGLPSEAVTRAKRERYERIALAYVTDHFFGEAIVRFDVVSISVLPGERAFVRHHVGAYSAG